MRALVLATCFSCVALAAYAAPKAKAPAPTDAPKEVVVSSALPTSALFFSTCAESMCSEDNFNKQMDALAKSKVAVKMNPEQLKGMVNDKEAQNAWGVKGFADPKKVLLLTYNKADNICGMHASDVGPEDIRHAFQADLKKFIDQHNGKVKVFKPEKKDDLTAYGAEVQMSDKTLQFGIAISEKTGEAFLTTHL